MSVVDAKTLRALRGAKGWDQATLARQAGISPPVVSRLERGLQDDLDASILVALAEALDTPVDSLLVAGYQQVRPELVAELAAAVAQLARLSEAQQRQVAAILHGYVSMLPQDGIDS